MCVYACVCVCDTNRDTCIHVIDKEKDLYSYVSLSLALCLCVCVCVSDTNRDTYMHVIDKEKDLYSYVSLSLALCLCVCMRVCVCVTPIEIRAYM